MVRTARKTVEDWPSYMKRASHHAEGLAVCHGVADWAILQTKRKFDLAARCLLHSDRWSNRLVTALAAMVQMCTTQSRWTPVQTLD